MTDHLQLPQKPVALRVMPQPSDANVHGDVFGGWIMAQVDIAGSIPASRRANGRVATIAVNSFVFKQPVFVGDLLSFYADIVKTGNTSVTVSVEVYAQRMSLYRRRREGDRSDADLCRHRSRPPPARAARARLKPGAHARPASVEHDALAQQAGNRVARHRAGEEVALHLVAVACAQEVELRRRLHAFRDHLQLQRMRERDDREVIVSSSPRRADIAPRTSGRSSAGRTGKRFR